MRACRDSERIGSQFRIKRDNVVYIQKQNRGTSCFVRTDISWHRLLPSIEPVHHIGAERINKGGRLQAFKRRKAQGARSTGNQPDTADHIIGPDWLRRRKNKGFSIIGIIAGIYRNTIDFGSDDPRPAWKADTFKGGRKTEIIAIGHSSNTTSCSQSWKAASASSFSRPC